MAAYQPTHAAQSPRKSGKRTPRTIPLHLLMTSVQGDASQKPLRSFRAPRLDGSSSPFNEEPSTYCIFSERFDEASSGRRRSHSVDVPCAPHTAPHSARRPHPCRLQQLLMCKLPALEGSNNKELESEPAAPSERGSQTVPASRQKPVLFIPAPPSTATPPSKTPRHKHVRKVVVSAVTGRTSSCVPPTPKESAAVTSTSEERSKSARGSIPCQQSTKSISSQSTACPSDAPAQQPTSPQEDIYPSSDTPAGSVSAVMSLQHEQLRRVSKADVSISTRCQIAGITKWKKGDQIGTGSYGCVFKARNASNGHLFVVKESVVNDQMYHEKLQHELEICKDLDHAHIVKCLGHEYVDRHLYIFLEYVAGGSLQCALREFGPLEQELMPTAMQALLEGLEYLHTRSPPVVHRDVKSANVLVGPDFCLKLADFGCSKCDDLTTSFTTVGSVLWMAPEVIRCENGGFGRKADIWSLGCVFIEMATAERPWKDHAFDNVWQAMRHIEGSEQTPSMPDNLPETIRSLIVRCVRRSPSQRAGASELLAHDLFQAKR